jgi:hypothetical protein
MSADWSPPPADRWLTGLARYSTPGDRQQLGAGGERSVRGGSPGSHPAGSHSNHASGRNSRGTYPQSLPVVIPPQAFFSEVYRLCGWRLPRLPARPRARVDGAAARFLYNLLPEAVSFLHARSASQVGRRPKPPVRHVQRGRGACPARVPASASSPRARAEMPCVARPRSRHRGSVGPSHTGELELLDGDVGGFAVNLAARMWSRPSLERRTLT